MPEPAALITGGTSGIGIATAKLLHERGFQVIVTGQNPETIVAARRELPEEVTVIRADSRSLDDAERLAQEVKARLGTLTALFLNAGISRSGPVESIDESTFDMLFAVNTKGQFFTLQKVLPLLTDGASVVFTVGIGVSRGIAGGSVTAASRGALLAMVPSLAIELAPRRIRVNALSPGAIDTPIWAKLGLPDTAVAAVQNSLAAAIPLGRLGHSHEVAQLAGFLLSTDSSYVTGENITVGGGIGVAS